MDPSFDLCLTTNVTNNFDSTYSARYPPYALATVCPVLTYAILLRLLYEKSGIDAGYAPIRWTPTVAEKYQVVASLRGVGIQVLPTLPAYAICLRCLYNVNMLSAYAISLQMCLEYPVLI